LAALSPWLQLMLSEIARKRAELEHARLEALQRARESGAHDSPAQQPGVFGVREQRVLESSG
jgi:hypothetical protein